MRLLLDTNILVDYFGKRAPFFAAWEQLSIMQMVGDAELWVSAESFTDVFYLLRKNVGSERLQAAFGESFEFLNVCAVGESELAEAAKAAWSDFEDGLINICAERVKADYLITRDTNGFKNARIPVYSPVDFFCMMEREYGIAYGSIEL